MPERGKAHTNLHWFNIHLPKAWQSKSLATERQRNYILINENFKRPNRADFFGNHYSRLIAENGSFWKP